ncbi:MAG: hypothetical protein JXQ29_07870 [Planctomycetes bacterium]|nr:hypothetical protein [Planctomycetota bacterium]
MVTIAMQRRARIATVTLALALVAMGAATAQQEAPPAPPPAAAPAEEGPERPRLVVMADAAASRPDLSREAALLVRQALMKDGYPIVSHEWALRLAQPDKDAKRPLTENGYASVLVVVDVAANQERKQQGRYRVELTARVRVTNVEDATLLAEEALPGRGTSFDGYPQAHRQAIDELGPAIGAKVAASLRKLEADEKEQGALFTVGVVADSESRGFAATLNKRLSALEKAVPESISLVRSVPEENYYEFRLRYRGRSHGLVEALYGGVQQLNEEAKAREQILEMDFAASTRRVLLHLHTRRIEPETSIDKEVQRLVNGLVGQIATEQKPKLAQKRLAVEPTSIPPAQGPRAQLESFARSYLRAVEAAERKAAAEAPGDAGQDALDRGPVLIEGTEFPTLRAAQARLEELGAAYRGSRAGTLAMDIAQLVDGALKKAEFSVLPAETDVETVLDRIQREAVLYQEEGAIEPGTIAELNTRGAEALVLTWFRPFLENYLFRITVLDCQTGEALVQLSRIVDQQFKGELDKVFQN